MSCITQLLALKGDKDFIRVNEGIVIEGGGVYKDHEYLVVFTSAGHRCGYVALKPEENAIVEKSRPKSEYHYYPDDLLDCHGGITFYDNQHAAKLLLPVHCEDFWVGFDAAHCYDAPDPELAMKYFKDDDGEAERRRAWQTELAYYDDVKHRDFLYMESECHKIIDQLMVWESA